MNVPTFSNRWLIVGTLTTESELHIGDGRAGALHERSRPAGEVKDEADASTVCTDCRGRSYVPGSALKGTLRALVTDASGKILREWQDLLGSDSPEERDAVGGKLEFWNAFHIDGAGTAAEQPDPQQLFREPDNKRPWWDDTRKTAIAVSVSLDRRTRTAKENLLYHIEYVPTGERFQVEIGGDNLSEEEVGRLLVLLDRFNLPETKRLTLGALATNGWGKLKWERTEIRRLNSVEAWKNNPTVGLTAAPKVEKTTLDKINDAMKSVSLPDTTEQLVIDLLVVMESPWLVRDARQTERSAKAKEGNVPEADRPADAVSILDESGKPFDPAKSLRGALRVRAEMILRTLGLPCADHPSDNDAVSTKDNSVPKVIEKIQTLDLAARLFGLSGWRAPVQVSRLVLVGSLPEPRPQEFVAIDRFTGAAAGGAKFNAKLAGAATLKGQLTVDLGRLRIVDETYASLGLLSLVLRDLAEGDIPIGSGSAKGQGACTATVTIRGTPDWRAHRQIVDGLAALRRLPAPSGTGEGRLAT